TGTLRETGETVLPMKAGIIAVLVNLCLNYILIFGKFGVPAMGVVGAAVATVISRIVECMIVVIWSIKHKENFPFMFGIFKNFHIPADIMKKVLVKGMPLLVNEFLWSASVTMITHCYSMRGLAAVGGINICNTINNVFNIVFLAFGDAIAILVGHLLGAGKLEEAKDSARKMRVFAVLICTGIAIIMAVTAPFFPYLYNTTDEVRHLATQFIIIIACLMPVCTYTNASYFTLRSGGKTFITFLFDSVYAWCFVVPLGLLLAYKTTIPVVPMYMICQGAEIIKMFIAYILVKKDVWIQNLAQK
ncbi:MAG: MATE family efflux transporter, partial [Coprococcus sp.]